MAITALAPSGGLVGTKVVIQGYGFTTANNTVHFGKAGYSHRIPSHDGKTIEFTIPAGLGVCRPFSEPVCPQMASVITPGEYSVSIINGNGIESNSMIFRVLAD